MRDSNEGRDEFGRALAVFRSAGAAWQAAQYDGEKIKGYEEAIVRLVAAVPAGVQIDIIKPYTKLRLCLKGSREALQSTPVEVPEAAQPLHLECWELIPRLKDLVQSVRANSVAPGASDIAAQRAAEQRRLAETALGFDILAILCSVQGDPSRELQAFNGCGGQRWSKNLPAKERGKGYDNVRHMISEMVTRGLLMRPKKEGRVLRGQCQITDEGRVRYTEAKGARAARASG